MTAPATDARVDRNHPVTDETRSSAPGAATTADVSTRRGAKTDPVLHTYKRAPQEIVRGEGVYLFDADGKRYLDFVSGIAVNALGYADPGLLHAMHTAADGLVHVSNLYETAPATALAAKLVERSFADKVF